MKPHWELVKKGEVHNGLEAPADFYVLFHQDPAVANGLAIATFLRHPKHGDQWMILFNPSFTKRPPEFLPAELTVLEAKAEVERLCRSRG